MLIRATKEMNNVIVIAVIIVYFLKKNDNIIPTNNMSSIFDLVNGFVSHRSTFTPLVLLIINNINPAIKSGSITKKNIFLSTMIFEFFIGLISAFYVGFSCCVGCYCIPINAAIFVFFIVQCILIFNVEIYAFASIGKFSKILSVFFIYVFVIES